jgi:hypothetical protein
MSKFKISGTLIEKSEPHQYSDKFTKQEIVVETSGRYPDYIKLEVVNDDMKMLKGIKTLEEVDVEGYIQGRKYTDKKTNELRYMTSLRLRSIKKVSEVNQEIDSEEFTF